MAIYPGRGGSRSSKQIITFVKQVDDFHDHFLSKKGC